MAAEGPVKEFCSESARLREEVVCLTSRRLEQSIPKVPECLKIAKVLSKRKRKWRKKQNLEPIRTGEITHSQKPKWRLKMFNFLPTTEYRPLNHIYRQEREAATDAQINIKDVLVHRRQEAIASARQIEKEKGEHYLEAIVSLEFKIYTHALPCIYTRT